MDSPAHKPTPPLFSVITPSLGARPRALFQAMASVARAAEHAGLGQDRVEMLVGYDGVKGPRSGPDSSAPPAFVRFFDLPFDGNFGNAIRQTLIRAARGDFLLFVDDDNALAPEAFTLYAQGLDHEMQIGRVDTSLAFDKPFLPEVHPDQPLVRQGNVDPLCLCLSRELVAVRCGGWRGEGGYESDYLNILRYWRRAASTRVIEAVVGVYDAGCGLDEQGLNSRQRTSKGRACDGRQHPPGHEGRGQ